MKCVAIIPSGGIGSRFNSPIPKQYIKVKGKEIIAYTFDIFQKCELVNEIIVPAGESYFELLNQIRNDYGFSKISKIIKGGKERQNSVFNGLTCKTFEENDLVIVHDAARPLLSLETLENAINLADKYDSITVAIKARDTLFHSDSHDIKHIDRSNIYYAQTPQIFRYKILIDSFNKAIAEGLEATDESMIVKNANYNVKIVDGEFKNFKITNESDLVVFEKLVT